MTPTYAGLALTMLATLLTELAVSRLLSVITWYHLAFVAIAVAMLGAAAGAVAVFVAPERFPPQRTATDLARWSGRFAIALSTAHLLSLVIPVPDGQQWRVMDLVALALVLTVITLPFALGGVVTTLALTRTTAPVGRLYAADLAGAAAGCLLAVLLLDRTNLSTVAFTASAVAAAGTLCFRRAAGLPPGRLAPATMAVALVAAAANTAGEPIHVLYPKNRTAWHQTALRSLWNSHAHVLAFPPRAVPAFYWGAGAGAERFTNTESYLLLDGEAGTPMTEWDGDAASLDWTSYDVTALVYHVRRGGRDVLTAIWSGSPAVTGVEINGNVVRLLTEYHRRFTRLADHPAVSLVHDEGRAYLTRTSERYDVLQVSLVDTWAATGAGAFTLSENGLYTREAWRIFLDRLTPTGVLSVSRWYSPIRVSETSRLVALAVQAMLDRGVRDPAAHLALVTREPVATLLASPTPFSAADLDAIDAVAAARGFTVLASPRVPANDARVGAILRSRSTADLTTATTDPVFDYSPPTDARPFFFNMVRPRAWWSAAPLTDRGVMAGNLRATGTLLAIFAVSLVFVLAAIAVPLVARGRPAMPPAALASGLGYFSVIGTAFMLAQVGFLQRFSVLLGHPTYALAVVLFSMILFTGAGSFWSPRLLGATGRGFVPCMLALGAALLAIGATIAPLCATAVAWSLAARIGTVLAVVAPVSVLLGVCFPHGAALVQRRDPSAVAWMWGANGAASVLASIAAVMIAMTFGIEANLVAAGAAYVVLPLLAKGFAAGQGAATVQTIGEPAPPETGAPLIGLS
ncbi:MAG: spermidine synthase [Vicinamibacterales bacterium]